MKNIFDLSGKSAVVTGGAGLLGRSLVKRLAGFGASVYIAEPECKRADEVCGELAKEGLKAEFIRLDITREAAIKQCVKTVVSKKGGLDIWVNNAYPRTRDWGLPFEKIPSASWRKNVDQHLNAYCLCCREAAEQMKRQKNGSIINIASIYGMVGPDFSIYSGTNMTMPAAYAAIKGGIINFSRYLASYYGRFGVRINTISPGGIFHNQPKRFVDKYVQKTPLGRMACPEDIAGAVVYLASDAGAYVTGHNLVVDGGWSAI